MENSRAEHIDEGLAAAEFAELEARYIAALDARYNGDPSAAYLQRDYTADKDAMALEAIMDQEWQPAFTVPQLLQKIADAAEALDYEAFCERIGEPPVFRDQFGGKNHHAWDKWLVFQLAATNLAELDGLLEKIIGEESK